MEPFRILDLGAHDGFVTNFIARRAKQAGRDLHVDGVEANKQGVVLFNHRADRDGIPGECKQGLAEDAPELFKEHSYDAVVMFELIEHAPDVDALLSAAERMVKFNGRIYVSTPNGTFGAGRNPHHLRVWTMADLFDLLRRRGVVHNALPGPDGVSVVSYSPRSHNRQEVAIYVGAGWEEWAPSDIETKGLGGSETAAVRLAAALQEYDCRVTVYGETAAGAVGEVLYRPHGAFDPTDHRDLLIVSRIPEVFNRRVNATRKLLWLHDVDCGDRFTAKHFEQIDRIMCLSQWHCGHLLETYPFLAGDDLYITRNGIEPSYFTGDPVERNPHRALYTSSPDRGLDLLLEWWPLVRERLPDAELGYAYATVYDAVASKDKRIGVFREHVRRLGRQPGVTNLGSLTQPGVAEQMRASGVWLAPSYSTPAGQPFYETFCIGAVEAAAAGCVRVMSKWGALEERDEHEASLWVPPQEPGDPYPDEEAFVDAIVEAMETAEGGVNPSTAALEMDWSEVAADMLAAAANAPVPV